MKMEPIMVDRRNMVGNEFQSGGRSNLQRTNQAVHVHYDQLQERRKQLITLAADPPPLPVPAPLAPVMEHNPSFNLLAYSVLLIAVLGIVSVATNYINWAFLAYGLLAVAARLPSTQMFVAALISLVLIPISSALQRNSLASSFSVMTFYFLVIGLIRASLELRRDTRRKAAKLKKHTPRVSISKV
jgi:hypothetical protein